MSPVYTPTFLLMLLSFLATPPRPTDEPLPTQARSVRVGVYQNAPKVFLDEQGTPSGIFIDLIRHVADTEGWDLAFVPGTWAEGLSRLEEGLIDIMPDVAYSDERAERFDLGDTTVISDWFELFTARDSGIETFSDLQGKRIAVVDQSIQETVLGRTLDDLGITATIVPVGDHEKVMEAIAADVADCGVVNRFFAATQKDKYRVAPTSIVFYPTRLVFATTRGRNGDLLATLDKDLARLKENGTSYYYQVLGDWLSERPVSRIPNWLIYLLVGSGSMLIIAVVFVRTLRHEVRTQTEEIRQKSEELERALDELTLAQQRAIQQERMHAMGQMASGIAHDFNNAIAPILGHVEIMLMDRSAQEDSEKVRERLERIKTSVRNAAQIVERMRGFYKNTVGAGHREPIQVNGIIAETVEIIRPRWETQPRNRDITITLDLDMEETPPLVASESEIREILVNLIFNAVDAMAEDGTITIRTRCADETIEVSVIDTGEGMSPETIESCLEPFFTTKGEDGTGMGLAMVQSIVSSYGGELQLESRPGEGTSVTLRFPVSPDVLPGSQQKHTTSAVRPLNILVVDDNLQALATLKDLLETKGHSVLPAASGDEALERIKDQTPDLAILDLNMPDMSGTRLARVLRIDLPGLPVLLLTGSLRGDETPIPPPFHALGKPATLEQITDAIAGLGFDPDHPGPGSPRA